MVYSKLQSVCKMYKDKKAIVLNNGVVTFTELLQAVDNYSELFLNKGMGKGSLVSIYSNNHVEYIFTLFAIGKIGAIAVPIDNLRLTETEKSAIINTVIPDYCIKYDENNNVIIEDFTKRVDNNHKLNVTDNLERHTSEFTILFTSGTTGVPKGIVHTQQTRMNALANLTKTLELTDKDSHLCTFVLTSPHATAICILPSLLNGSTLYIIPPEKVFPRIVCNYIKENSISIYTVMPHFIMSILNTKEIPLDTFKTIRQILCGGAPMIEKAAKDFKEKYGIKLGNIYGMAEHGPMFVNKIEYDDVESASIGKTLDGVEAKIVDQDGKDLEINQIGEIRVRSNSVAKGYWNNVKETKKVFLKDRWLSTMDLGYVNEKGYYFVTGRISEYINISSNKVSPYEIENVIMKYGEVKEVVVIGKKLENSTEKIIAVVVPTNKNTFYLDGLKQYCEQNLAPFKRPSQIIISDDFPRGSYGKIDKGKVRSIYE